MAATQRAIPKPRESELTIVASVDEPRRDTSEWDKGRLQQYQEQNLAARPGTGAGGELGTPGKIHPGWLV